MGSLMDWIIVHNPWGEIAKCAKETNHAQVSGSCFCRCTRMMYSYARILSESEVRAGLETGRLPAMLEEARNV